MNIIIERLLDSIGDIDDSFLLEAETADITRAKVAKRKQIAKYSAAGVAVSVGIAAVAYLVFKPRKPLTISA